MDTVKAFLTWYLNLFSNGWNAECDICWAGHIATAHLLTGWLPWPLMLCPLALTVVMKKLKPTLHDLGITGENT